MQHTKGTDGICETVQVQGTPSDDNPTGIISINQSDYDADPSAYTLVVPPALAVPTGAESDASQLAGSDTADADADADAGKKRRGKA
jgi:hypothetical protein